MKKLATAALFSCAAFLSAAPAEKLLHVDFEDIKATKDVTGNISIRAFGGVKSVPGVVGKAALFDGKKAAIRTVGKDAWKFDPETSFTIEFYIKPERNDSKGWTTPVMLKGLRFSGRPHINSPFLFIRAAKKSVATIGTGTASYNNGKWHHIAMSRDAEKREISYFCNGKKIKTVKETPELTSTLATPDSVYFGAAGYFGYYKGAIDEFIIWKGVKKSFELSNLTKLNKVEQPKVEIDKNVSASWKVLKEHNINLVPAPKTIKISGKAFDFKPQEWGVERKEKSDAPGYEYFTKRLAGSGIKGAFPAAGSKRIVAGLYKDIAGELSFKAKIQPRQGYVIDVTPEKIVIAGTDEDGLRYGWLTLSALVSEKGKLFPAQITDYPDYVVRMGHYGPYSGTEQSVKRVIDEAFVLRINTLFSTRILPLQKLPPHLKAAHDYAKARGIKCGYVGVPSVEDIENFKKKIPRGQDGHSYSYRSDEGMFGWYGHAISWSRDDLAEAHAKKAVDFLKKYGFTAFMLHPVDAGGIDNPSRWNSRSKKCRERWGNDFFSAQENLIKIYCDTFKKYYPECKVYYVAYPYMPKQLLVKKFSDHVRRLNKILGSDVKFIVREGLVKDMNALQKITSDFLTDFYPFQYDYLNIHCNAARYMTTFYVNGLDSCGGYEIWGPGGSRGHASRYTYTEYMWNTKAPGAANKPEGHYTSYELITEECPETDRELLPRICAYVYGEKAGAVMAKVFAAKLSERHSEHPFKVLPSSIDQEKYFADQVALTDKLIEEMNATRQFVRPDALDVWKSKYSYVRYVNIGSRARLHCVRANKYAEDGKVSEAQAEADKGIALLNKKSSRGYRAVKTLKRELDISEKLKSGSAKRAYAAQHKKHSINVAFYQYTGTGNGGSSSTMPLLSAYNKVGGIKTFSVSDPTVNILKNVDVMVFAATKYVGDTSEDWRTNIRNMVEKDGKGVIFCHNAVGREKLTNLGKSIFPEICADFDSRVAANPELIVENDVPFRGFLKKGDKYREGYVDHMTIKPGKNAVVLLRDGTGKVVAAAGKVGKGYVVYTGEIFGVYGKKDLLREPDLDNWKMLYHLIRYASGK